jgi:3-methyladenine DNA glycosylase AlkD
MTDILDKIRKDLLQHASATAKTSAERYFKDSVKIYGVTTPVVTNISKIWYKSIEDKSKSNIFNLCTGLWKSGYIEESIIACNWSYSVKKQYEKDDFYVFEEWVTRYVDNWASCDTLCNHTVGTLVELYPEHLNGLNKWARSKNKWVRRAAAVTLIIPAKKGLFLKEILEIADILLTDNEDMVRKGYGWMLKAASHSHQEEVFNYIMKNKYQMPRTSLRYAIEKMPSELKALAMC